MRTESRVQLALGEVSGDSGTLTVLLAFGKGCGVLGRYSDGDASEVQAVLLLWSNWRGTDPKGLTLGGSEGPSYQSVPTRNSSGVVEVMGCSA